MTLSAQTNTVEWPALLRGGPLDSRRMMVRGEPGVTPFDKPARFQQFYRALFTDHGFRTDREGILTYELLNFIDDVWVYIYSGYGEACID